MRRGCSGAGGVGIIGATCCLRRCRQAAKKRKGRCLVRVESHCHLPKAGWEARTCAAVLVLDILNARHGTVENVIRDMLMDYTLGMLLDFTDWLVE
jgi:hypothetical protein